MSFKIWSSDPLDFSYRSMNSAVAGTAKHVHRIRCCVVSMVLMHFTESTTDNALSLGLDTAATLVVDAIGSMLCIARTSDSSCRFAMLPVVLTVVRVVAFLALCPISVWMLLGDRERRQGLFSLAFRTPFDSRIHAPQTPFVT